MVLRLALLLGVSLSLVACQAQTTKGTTPDPVVVILPAKEAKVEVIEETPPPVQEEVKTEEEVAILVIEVDDNPDQFLGASLSKINEKIGAPIFARRDGNIEVWQYRRDWKEGMCHLDLFLYPVSTSTGTDIRVKFTDLRSQFLTQDEQKACFAEMLRDHIRHSNPPVS